MNASMTGMTTAMSPDSRTFSRSAMTTPPTAVIGADTMNASPMRTTCCTCCTSFVLRVIRDGAPKSLTSRSEKPCTRRKIADRTSRPKPMAASALNHAPATAATASPAVTASITPPVRTM